MTIDPIVIAKALDTRVAEKAYDDGISTPLKEVSGFVTDVFKTIRLVLFPVQLAAFCQDKFKEILTASAEKVSPENRILPPSSILVPILNHLSYIEDGNILADLFQSLLSKAMDKTRNSEVHPAFITTINQLSQDEAFLLLELKYNKFKFIRLSDLDSERNKFYNHKIIDNEFPLNKLIFPDNFQMYLSHLEKLDLIFVHDKESELIFNLDKDSVVSGQKGAKETYTIGFTEFGDLFVKACLPEK
jgi:abortive infection alpha-like protein